MGLTCQEARDAHRAVGEQAGVVVQVVKRQQLTAIVPESRVDSQQPEVVGEVAHPQGHAVLTAIHKAAIQEGSEGVDLVAGGDVAPCAGWAGPEEGDAVTLVPNARIIGWDLQ